MSYEGYDQRICTNGHYFTNDAFYLGMGEDELVCPFCKGQTGWVNCVDQTNGDDIGYISEEVLKEKFLITPKVIETCNLGHEHMVSPAIYRVPTKEETDPLRKIYDPDGVLTEDDMDINNWKDIPQ